MMDKPEVTQAMLDAADRAVIEFNARQPWSSLHTAIYRAMRLARPLSEGPGA